MNKDTKNKSEVADSPDMDGPWPTVDYKTIPDDGPAPLVLAYLRACAKSWEPEVRILGNLRACDVVRVLNQIEGSSSLTGIKDGKGGGDASASLRPALSAVSPAAQEDATSGDCKSKTP